MSDLDDAPEVVSVEIEEAIEEDPVIDLEAINRRFPTKLALYKYMKFLDVHIANMCLGMADLIGLKKWVLIKIFLQDAFLFF